MGLSLATKVLSICYIKKLKRLDKIEGHLGLNEGILLFKIAKSLKENSVIVEIGAFKGKSTCFIAEGIGPKRCQFFSIDTWLSDTAHKEPVDTFDTFLENTKEYRNKIITLRGFSYDIIKEWPKDRRIDFLWIDGDHSYEAVKKDIDDWVKLVNRDSFICFHDYRDAPGVKKAVDEAVNSGRIKFIRKEGCMYVSNCTGELR